MDAAEVRNVFREALASTLAEAELRQDEDASELAATGEALVSNYVGEAARSVQPPAVELPVEGEVAGVKVRGIVDVVDTDGRALDFKTASKRRGWAVNHKRVYRLMRADNLLCLWKRRFVVTTDSDLGLPVYPNLARWMVLTGRDQLWVADLTYIRLELEFAYLAVILDAFSRRVIGWALDRTLETELTLQALRIALARRHPAPGLVYHSDRGVRYASRDYTQLLQHHGIQISMSRKANPWDNAACESFLKTLKFDEVYRAEYRDLADARLSLGVFLEKVYNQKRLHSALGYRPPVDFERGRLTQDHKEAAARHFF
jgi:putative transposase